MKNDIPKTDQRKRDKLLHSLLKMPPQPRPKRERDDKPKRKRKTTKKTPAK